MTMLNLDISVIFISLLILLLMTILNKIYYKPVGTIIQKREEKIEQDSAQLENMTNEIEEKTQTIEKILLDTKRETIRLKEELIQKGENVRDQIVNEAREKSKILFENKMEELDGQITQAETKLIEEIRTFNRELKKTLL
jgi:F-type H+-transporting ATPase subunit b